MIISHISGAIGVRLGKLILKQRGVADISFIDENFGIGGVSSIQSIAKNDIKNILDLRKEAHHDPNEIKKFSINYLNIKISDRDSPTFQQAIEAIKWMKERKGKILIHCNLGRGRAPSLGVLYLIYNGLDADNAIRVVKKSRKLTYFNKTQLKMLYSFEQELKQFGKK